MQALNFFAKNFSDARVSSKIAEKFLREFELMRLYVYNYRGRLQKRKNYPAKIFLKGVSEDYETDR